MSILTPLHRVPCLYHVSACENFLSFRPATPRAHSPQQPGKPTTVHCCLTFEEDNNSSLDNNSLHTRMEHHSPVEHPMDCHLPSADEEEDGEEHFPTAPLNDEIWMKEPVPDRHLHIHEHSQHDLCSYLCPYSWDHFTYLSTWISATFLTFQ